MIDKPLELKLLPHAWHDLVEIGMEAERHGVAGAGYNVTIGILRRLKDLQSFNMLGGLTPLRILNEHHYRMLHVDEFDCIYRRIDDVVYVYHITELKRDYPKLVE